MLHVQHHEHPDSSPLALFGGAYGNLPALRACLDDAVAAGAATLAFLGDATGCCGHSDATLAAIEARCPVLVAGNHEREAAAGSTHCNCGYGDAEDERWGCRAHDLAMTSLAPARARRLAAWPDQAVIHSAAGGVLCCHGSPERINEFLYESELDDERLRAWLATAGCRLLACTHTGLPWIRPLGDGRFAVNCGVVGKPDHDGDPAVHYALLHLEDAGFRPEIRRVAYDHESWAARLSEAGVEAIFTRPLRDGWWTVGRNSLPHWERERRVTGVRSAPSSAGPGAAGGPAR